MVTFAIVDLLGKAQPAVTGWCGLFGGVRAGIDADKDSRLSRYGGDDSVSKNAEPAATL